MLDLIARTATERGLAPETVADMVVDGIAENRFFILTHPEETLAAMRTRLRWMETGERPGARLPSAAAGAGGPVAHHRTP